MMQQCVQQAWEMARRPVAAMMHCLARQWGLCRKDSGLGVFHGRGNHVTPIICPLVLVVGSAVHWRLERAVPSQCGQWHTAAGRQLGLQLSCDVVYACTCVIL